MKTGKALEPGRVVCGARKKQSRGFCRLPAGFRTDHPGIGKCYLHGGATPCRHGRYSVIKRETLRELIAHYEADPDPLNVLPELAFLRALVDDLRQRRQDKFTSADDLTLIREFVAEISRIIERVERNRAQSAISRVDLFRVMSEMGRVVKAHVREPETLDRIRGDWLSIRLA